MQTNNSEEKNKRNEDLTKWIETVKNENTRNYIEIRIMPQMEYYSHASRKNKKQYLNLRILTIVFGALIPVATLFSDYGIPGKLTIMILGTSVSAITAYLELLNYDKLWRSYRIKREQLLGTLMCYFTDVGVFATVSDQKQKDAILVETCEQCMLEEHEFWQKITDARNSSQKKKDEETKDF